MADVPVTQPATVQKNSDGTYSVRIQHHNDGVVSEVHFPNVVFAETMANSYAAFINGLEKAETAVKEAMPEVKADAKNVLATAEKEAAELIQKSKASFDEIVLAARKQAAMMQADAELILDKAKAEAEKLLAEAKAEAAKLLAEAKLTKKTKSAPKAEEPKQEELDEI